MRRFVMRSTGFFTQKRNLFVVSLEYKVPLDKVNEHLDAHRRFLEECYQQQKFIVSGRKEPRTGGIIIASTKTKNELLSLLENDPFKKNNIAHYEIIEFFPTMNNPDLSKIIERDNSFRK